MLGFIGFPAISSKYYHDYLHGWKRKNPEKQRQYNEDYIERKRGRKDKLNL